MLSAVISCALLLFTPGTASATDQDDDTEIFRLDVGDQMGASEFYCGDAENDPARFRPTEVPAEIRESSLFLTVGRETLVANHTDGQTDADGWQYGNGITDPGWSLNGSFLVFTKQLQRFEREDNTWHIRKEIWVLCRDGRGARRLTEGTRTAWIPPVGLGYEYYATGTDPALDEVHYASIDLISGDTQDCETRPEIPRRAIRWGGRDCSIPSSNQDSTAVADTALQQLIFELEKDGAEVREFDFSNGTALFCRTATGEAPAIYYCFDDRPAETSIMVRNGSAPALSPGGCDLAFIRDGNLWVKERAHPVHPDFARIPFPEADEAEVDTAIASLVRLRIAQWNEAGSFETERRIVAMGARAVPTLIAMAKLAANQDRRVLGYPGCYDYGAELRMALRALAEIGDRRAISMLTTLMKYDYRKCSRMQEFLSQLLCHGTDEQIAEDARSADPNLARAASQIHTNSFYDFFKREYRANRGE